MNEKQYYQQDIVEIDLRELYYLFLQHIFPIVLAFVLGAAAVGCYFHFLVPPSFTATAKLYVVSASNDSVVNLSDLQIGTNLTADYKQLILNRPMMESTLRKLDLQEETVSSLREKIGVENPSGTRILEISATMGSPKEAADVANTVANLAVSWLPAVMESNAPNIAEEAIPPTTKSAPHVLRNAAIGAVVCAFAVYVFYLVAYLLDDTIRTEEDMEKYFDMIPLASVPKEQELKHKKNEKIKKNSERHSSSQKEEKGGRTA